MLFRSLRNYNKIVIINNISYLDLGGVKKLLNLPPGSFFGASLTGALELYMLQVMGVIPEFINGRWHDNYIFESKLSETDLKFDCLETYIFNKNNFFFNSINIFNSIRYKIIN